VSSLAAEHRGTRFMAVRFCNVPGSSASVIPKFKERIARGGPITATRPGIIRFFMAIPEAAPLVLQVAAIGESGQVLALDMELHEELLADADATIATPIPRLRIARLESRAGSFEELLDCVQRVSDDTDVRATLQRLVPEYTPR